MSLDWMGDLERFYTGERDLGGWIDLGHEHAMRYYGWAPDRDLNPQYEGISDVERAGVTVAHITPGGVGCMSGAMFDTMPSGVVGPNDTWHVESEDPLTLSPSLLCRQCGDHGFIRGGRWVPA